MRRTTEVLVVVMGLCLSGTALGQPYTPPDQHQPSPQRPQTPTPDPPPNSPTPDATEQDQEYLEYLAALKKCQQLSAERRDQCIRETKQNYDRM
jgi:hypothetical protein